MSLVDRWEAKLASGTAWPTTGKVKARRRWRNWRRAWSAIVVLCAVAVPTGDGCTVKCRADDPVAASGRQPAKADQTSTTNPSAVSTGASDEGSPAEHDTSPPDNSVVASESPGQTTVERERRARLLQQLRRGFAVLLVLVLLAVFVLVMFLLWGIRRRRRLRTPLPAIHKGDELWFLKPATQKPDDNPPATPPAIPPPPADEPPTNPNAE